ncbi:MAG: metallophosphoesterase family protein [Lachnospiraceae bacterium]
MKYAIIADIHANLPAFEAVLADAKEQGAAEYLICGDYFMCMPWANEIMELIRSLPNAYVIPGNEDLYFDKCVGKDLKHPEDAQFLAVYWAYQRLNKGHAAYIEDLPEQIEFSAQGIPVFMAHSLKTFAPETPEERLTSKVALFFKEETYTKEAYEKFLYGNLENNIRFQERIEALKKGIYVFGHSHLQWNYEKNGRIFINPGSCGFPLDGNPMPAYTLLTISDNGKNHTIMQRRVPYDLAGTVAKIRSSELYAYAGEWTEIIISEMETAFEQIAFFLQSVEQYAIRTGDQVRPYQNDTWRAAYDLWQRSRI